MKIKTVSSILAGTGLLAASASPAFAVVVDGIDIPTSPGQHVFAGTISQNITTTVGDQLTGSGDINTFDGSTAYCASGVSCSLSYTFSGFTLADITLPSEAADNTGTANFTGGQVTFYANGDTANPWLTLTADTELGSEYTLEGTLTNANTPQAQNTAVGLLSVTGGTAAEYFDNDTYQNGDGGMSDLLFNTSLSPQTDMIFTGSADAHYVSGPSEVPEPGALAMLGLGLTLVGFGASYRRRKHNS